MAAIQMGNLEELEKFHRAGMTITSTIQYGNFDYFDPFYHAVKNNDLKLFSFLLEKTKTDTPDIKHEFDTLILSVIDDDQPEFLERLEQFSRLSDNYDVNIGYPHRIPMINMAIIYNSPKVIEWLLGKKIDLTIKAQCVDALNFTVWRYQNAFDLAISKKDLTLLHKLMVKLANTNDNAIPLNKAHCQWLKDLINKCNVDGLALFISELEKFQNFSEIVKFLAEEAYKNKKTDFLSLLIRQYGQKLFESWNIWQQPKEEVFYFLKTISTLPESKNSIDHLQTLINDNVSDAEKINGFLKESFQSLCDEPAYLARSKKEDGVLPLIRACINLGATANPEYMLAYAIGEDNLPLFHKWLTTVTDSARRRGDSPEKKFKSLSQKAIRLVGLRSKKTNMHSTDKMPSTSQHKEQVENLFSELCQSAVISNFSENTLTMILSLMDEGANPYPILKQLINSRCITKTISDTDLLLIEKLIQRINESAHSEHKENFQSILVEILKSNLPIEVARLFIRYGTNVTSPVKAIDNVSIKQAVIETKEICRSGNDPKEAYWQDILSCIEEYARL